MYNLNRDHPAVEMIEATGYPHKDEEFECEYCGCTATWEKDGKFLCDECAMKEAMNIIAENKDIEEICEFAGMIAV